MPRQHQSYVYIPLQLHALPYNGFSIWVIMKDIGIPWQFLYFFDPDKHLDVFMAESSITTGKSSAFIGSICSGGHRDSSTLPSCILRSRFPSDWIAGIWCSLMIDYQLVPETRFPIPGASYFRKTLITIYLYYIFSVLSKTSKHFWSFFNAHAETDLPAKIFLLIIVACHGRYLLYNSYFCRRTDEKGNHRRFLQWPEERLNFHRQQSIRQHDKTCPIRKCLRCHLYLTSDQIWKK